ncbi:putative disease resistance protein RGA4 [Quercus suber]|uniref:putative disease resistance protein RGA4 n=1 Tax=Quercus suber TaxID=58331 RepID=UPI0032DFC1FB
MAETALSVVAEEILGKLISLATEQISVAWGFKDELMRLRKSVEMIQDVLADAERRQVSDRSVMRWLQRLKDVAYDADDVLDELAYEVLRRKVEIRNHMKRKETLHLEDNIRHLPLISNDQTTTTIPPPKEDMSHIRSFSLISNNQVTPIIPLSRDVMCRLRTIFWMHVDLGNKLLDLKCVRDLTLFGREIEELPNSIGEIRHLRLLRIEQTKIKVLPNSVTKLYNLQTLVIKDCYCLERLPKDLRNLISLRHIDIDHQYIKQLPINMGQLTCLQTLPFFVIGQDVGHRIEEVGCLSKLRGKLHIYNLEHVRDEEEAKTANLVGKAGVHKLKLHWNEEREGNNNDEDVLEGLQPHPSLKSLKIENFEGEKFPSWIWARNNSGGGGFLLEQLLKIRLENCNKCSKIPTLGHLPRLRVLQIEKMENVRCIGTEFYINYGGERSSHNGGVVQKCGIHSK